MSDTPGGPDWWQASDGKWYPPQGQTPADAPSGGSGSTPTGPQGPGWWRASDGNWYPPEQHPDFQAGAQTGPAAPVAGAPAPAAPSATPYAAGPPGGVPPEKRRSKAPLVIAIVAVLALIAAGVGWFLVSGDDGDGDTASSTTEPSGEPVLLQPIASDGPDPFTESVALADVDLGDDLPRVAGEDNRTLNVKQVSGTEPGLYGGTRNEQTCDVEQMADFLEGHPDQAQAWADVEGIDVEGLRDYLVALTPVLLLNDTWVTNHGWDADAGEATAFQAVLQAGTAVLVDDEGVPRARCACGNPLTPPTTEDTDLSVTDGDEWSGYDPGQVNLVDAGPAMTAITLVDIDTGEQYERTLGSGQTGDVQVTLRWQGDSDLDLHVIGPDGVEIYYGATTAPTGGELDIDVIPTCGTSGERIENIFWPPGTAPPGEYQVFVDNFSSCSGSPEPFELQVVANGRTQVSESGSVPPNGESERFTFQG